MRDGDERCVRPFAELFCPLSIADAQRRKSAPLVWNFARGTRTDLCISRAYVARRIGPPGIVARGRDGLGEGWRGSLEDFSGRWRW